MKNNFLNNREKFRSNLKDGEFAIFLSGNAPESTADSMYKFRPNKNFFYLTGIKREGFKLLLTKEEEVLFIEKPNYDIEKWVGRKLTKEGASKLSGINKIMYLSEFEAYLIRLVESSKYDSAYFDLIRMRYHSYETESAKLAKEIKDKFPELQIKNSHGMMKKLRVIKSDFEINEISKAIELTKNGLENIMNNLVPGKFEYELEAEFNYSIYKNGAEANAFDTIAASGENAVILHYVENEHQIKDGNLVLFDLGAQYHQYASDISRTYPANGKFSDRQREIYSIVLKTNKTIIDMIKPGVKFADLNLKCMEILSDELIRIGLIKERKEISKYYYHGVSHYMGLDVHDIGDRDVLEPGMVLTVEPGLYIQEEGIGIRIEDDILVSETGHINLSKAIIKEIDEIEEFMNK